jgi:hypothetical protein
MRLSDEVEAADWVSIRDRILWRMANALFAEFKRDADDLAVVVRAHLHIEHELDELIYFAAPNPTHLKERMEYSEKVWLALVLGMNAELKPALTAAGTLRNRFAHNLDTTLTKGDSKDLIHKLTREVREEMVPSLRELVQPRTSNVQSIDDFPRLQTEIFFLATLVEVFRERYRLGQERFQIVSTQAAQV